MTSWHLITGIFVLLLAFGLLMVLSASSIGSIHKNGSPFGAFENQALFAAIGLFGFLAANRLSTRLMRNLSLGAVAVSLLLLAVVLVRGNTGYGAKSWITVGPINLQPSELAKLSLLVWMSHVFAARRNTLRSVRTLLFPVVPVFLLMVLLIMLEPDLGTTITLTLIFVAVLWFGGAPLWMFGVMVVGLAGGGIMLATGAAYRNQRILSWLHPDRASADALLQIHQSLFGLGHGGLFGAGLGQAVSKSGWLPNADSDFIFAVIGEELGLIGAGLLVMLYGLLAYTGLRIARRNVDPFIKILASSATIWVVGQAAINIGYVVGLLPVTGLTLPMISRGGTSLVVTMVVFGMLANFARREPQAAAALHSQGPGRIASFLGLGPRPPKPPKARKPRPVTPKKSSPRVSSGRTAMAPPQRSARRPEPRPAGERPLPTGAAAGRGRAVADPSRRDRPEPPRLRRSEDGGSDGRGVDWTGRPFVEPRRPRPAETRTGDGRGDRPRAGARGDGARTNGSRADGSRADSARTNGSRANGARADGARADGARAEGTRPEGTRVDGSGRSRGRGRTVRP